VKTYHVFLRYSHNHFAESGRFPERYSAPDDALVYDRTSHRWFTMDKCPFHIDSVPKEIRAMALLLGIA